MLRFPACLLLLAPALVIADDVSTGENDVPPPPPTAEQVAAWIRELGDDDFFVREAATRRLWEAGPEGTRAALETALSGDDREAAYRARKILWNFKHGILVGTPPEVVQLVDRFHTGNASVQKSVIETLAGRGEVRTLIALLRNVDNAALRQNLAKQVSQQLERTLPSVLREQRYDEALDWLDLAAEVSGGAAVRDRNAFLLLHGGLAERIEQEQRLLAANATPERHAELARLSIVAGDLDAATEHAAKSNNVSLRREVALRRGDWSLVAKDLAPGDPGVEELAFRAVLWRRAGDEPQLARVADALEKLAKDEPSRAWICGEGLLLGERHDDALAVFRSVEDSMTAFELACAMGRTREAFEAIGVDLAEEGSETGWFEGLAAEAGIVPSKLQVAHTRGAVVLREIVRLQGRERGRALLEAMRAVSEKPNFGKREEFVEVAAELGFRREAFEVAAAAIADLKPTDGASILGSLFEDRERTAFTTWQWRRQHVAEKELEESPAASLEWVADVLAGRDTDVGLEAVIEAMAEFGRLQTESAPRVQWLKSASEIAHDRKRYELASACYAEVAESAAIATHRVWMGDIAAKAGDWSGAAEWYGRAAEEDAANGTSAMLHALAVVRAGDAERGGKLLEHARLMRLGDVAMRNVRALELSQRGFDEEARREWEMVLRLGSYGTFEGSEAWAVQLAFARLGNAISDDEPLRAADCWERYLTYFAKTNAAYGEVRRYLAVSHLAHRVRARGLLDEGKFDEALAAARRAHEVWPGNIELALQLVPRLDERDRKDKADALFALVHAEAAKRVKDFPANAGGLNDLAWLNAKCNRELDEALASAERAVELEPESAAYLDTLAEVHFQRGDREKAVVFAQKCLALEPNGEHYREQLERFRGE